MSSPMTVDVTTGDKITPESVEYSHPLLLDDRNIAIMSYSLATMLAEKLETAISRSVANTRPRDYYDLHTLWLTRRDEVKPDVPRDVVAAAAERRGSHAAMGNYREVMAQVASDDGMLGLWAAYARRYPYVGDMTLGGRVGRSCDGGRAGGARRGRCVLVPRDRDQAAVERANYLRYLARGRKGHAEGGLSSAELPFGMCVPRASLMGMSRP